MRQIHVKPHETLEGVDHQSSITLKLPPGYGAQDTVSDKPVFGILSGHVTYITFPLVIERHDGLENDFDLTFKVHKNAADQGVLLVGAYFEDGSVVACFSSIIGPSVIVKEGSPLLVVNFVERVAVRPLEPFGTKTPAPLAKPKPKSKRRR